MSPEQAIEILTQLIDEAQSLHDLPWDSAKRDEWTDTSRALLERAFNSSSSIFQNFGRAQAIVFNRDTTDEEMREKVNSILTSTVAVLQSAKKQLSWEIEANKKSPVKVLGSRKIDTLSTSDASEPSALNILQQAIKAVPAVKFALGVAGIVSVVAIIKGFNLDFRIAIFGTTIMLLLMTMLVIFARLAATTANIFKIPILIFTWFSLLMTIATATSLFTSVFFHWPVNLESWLVRTGDIRLWKLKVYDFRNFGPTAKDEELGERFSEMILDYLLKKQLDVKKADLYEDDAITRMFIDVRRDPETPPDWIAEARKLAPVIIVYGYADSVQGNNISVQIRVNRIDARLQETPLINRSVSLLRNQTNIESTVHSVGEEIYLAVSTMSQKEKL